MSVDAPYVDPGDSLTAALWNALIDYCRKLATPKVAAPLAIRDGVIYLADEFKLSDAFTTGTINPRQGLQLGSGPADLYLDDANGLLAVAPGYQSRTVWSDLLDPIPKQTKIKVYFARGKWRVFNALCNPDASPPSGGSS